MSKIIIQSKEKADIIRKIYNMQYKECSVGYEFELNNDLRMALKDLSR